MRSDSVSVVSRRSKKGIGSYESQPAATDGGGQINMACILDGID